MCPRKKNLISISRSSYLDHVLLIILDIQGHASLHGVLRDANLFLESVETCKKNNTAAFLKIVLTELFMKKHACKSLWVCICLMHAHIGKGMILTTFSISYDTNHSHAHLTGPWQHGQQQPQLHRLLLPHCTCTSSLHPPDWSFAKPLPRHCL